MFGILLEILNNFMSNPNISICIPTYEMNGKGVYFLNRLLKSIDFQIFQNYEVIISDHSNDNSIEEFVKHKNDKRIFYIKNLENRGKSAHNLNNSIKFSNTENLKIMFQDDFFCYNNALNIITDAFERDIKWGATGCLHYENKNYYRPHSPNWNKDIKIGVNTIGCPSVIFLKKEDILFDENLIWLMDTEFYWRMYKKYGLPFLIKDYIIAIGTHSDQVTNTLATDLIKQNELDYVLKKDIL